MRNPISKRAYFMKFVACFTLASFTYSFIFHQSAMAITALVQANALARQLQNQPEQLAIPSRYGRITSGSYSGSQRLVVYVQDLHCNPEVQKNIVNILNLFDAKYGINRIYLEGAPAGKLDTSLLGSIPSATIREKTIDGLLNKGLLGGGEYYALKFNQDKLYGLEEWAVYSDNLERYRKLSANKEMNKAANEMLAAKVDALKQKYLDRKLKRIEKVFNSDRKETRYLRIENLGERVGQVVTGYPNLSRYIDMIKLNRTIRYSRLNGELAKYVKELQRIIPMSAYISLTEMMNNPDTRDEFYRRLAGTAKTYTPDLERSFPELGRFFSYLELNYQLNPINLIEEERLFKDRVMAQYAERLLDKDLIYLSRLAGDLANYAELSMTPAQYQYFNGNREASKILLRKYFDREDVQDTLNLLNSEEYPKFYAVNFQRNGIFVKTIAQNVSVQKKENQPNVRGFVASADLAEGYESVLNHMGEFKSIDFVIAGGFHLDVAKLLKDNNVSSLMITPGVAREFDGSLYEQVMTGKIDYQKIPASALAPIADSLGIDQGTMVAMVQEMVQAAIADNAIPAKVEEIFSQWQKKQAQLNKIAITFKDNRFDIYVNQNGDPAFIIGLKVTGGNEIEIVQSVREEVQAIPGMQKLSATEKIEAFVAGKMNELRVAGQMLGFSRAEIVEAVLENLRTVSSSLAIYPSTSFTIELTALAEVLVQLMFDTAIKQHQSRIYLRKLNIAREKSASALVLKIIRELGEANDKIGNLIQDKKIVIKQVSGDFFPGKSLHEDLGFASMEVQGNTIVFLVSGDIWRRLDRGMPDFIKLLLEHELEEYLYLKDTKDHPKTYRDFHKLTGEKYKPLFEEANRKMVRSAYQQVHDVNNPDSMDRVRRLVAERVGVRSDEVSKSIKRVIKVIRGPPVKLDEEEKAIFSFIINAYTLGMLHSNMGHLNSEIDKLDIPLNKGAKKAREISYRIPKTSEENRLSLSMLGAGYCAYTFKAGQYIIKYLKSPAYRMLENHDYSIDYGVFEGKLDRTIWEYIRSNEKYPGLIVPTKVFISLPAFNALQPSERKQLDRFIAVGAVEIMPGNIYLHSNSFTAEDGNRPGPSDGDVTVSVAIVQTTVIPVLEKIRRAYKPEDAQEAIIRYLDYLKTVWQEGIFLVDASLKNVGFDENGDIKAFDVEDGGIDPASKKPVRTEWLQTIRDENAKLLPSDDLRSFYYSQIVDNENRDMFSAEGFAAIWKHLLPGTSKKQVQVLLRDPLVRMLLQALRGEYAGNLGDMSLEVVPLHDLPNDVIKAGIKTYESGPVIFAVNPTDIVQPETGKAWSSIDLPLVEWGILDDPGIIYHFRDMFTGETYIRSGTELYLKGFEIGLSEHRVHVLRIDDITLLEASPLREVLSKAFPEQYGKTFRDASSTLKKKKQFLGTPRVRALFKVLNGIYDGLQGERPLSVQPKTSSPDVLKAGIVNIEGHPTIVAVNGTSEKQAGPNKAWGKISLPLKALGILNVPDVRYHLNDVLSGKEYTRSGEVPLGEAKSEDILSGEELWEKGGIDVGLLPHGAQLIIIDENSMSFLYHTMKHLFGKSGGLIPRDGTPTDNGPSPLTANRALSSWLRDHQRFNAVVTAGMVIEEIVFAPLSELAAFSVLAQLYMKDHGEGSDYAQRAAAFVGSHTYMNKEFDTSQKQTALDGLAEIMKAAAAHPGLLLYTLWIQHLGYNYRHGTLHKDKMKPIAPLLLRDGKPLPEGLEELSPDEIYRILFTGNSFRFNDKYGQRFFNSQPGLEGFCRGVVRARQLNPEVVDDYFRNGKDTGIHAYISSLLQDMPEGTIKTTIAGMLKRGFSLDEFLSYMKGIDQARFAILSSLENAGTKVSDEVKAGAVADRSDVGFFQQTVWLLPWFPAMISLRLHEDLPEEIRDNITGELEFTDKNGDKETFPIHVRDGRIEAPFVLAGERYQSEIIYPFELRITVADTTFRLQGAQKVEAPKKEAWTNTAVAKPIVPGIYLGNARAVVEKGFLAGIGVKAVLNVAEERDTRYPALARGMAYRQFEFKDFTQNPLNEKWIWDAVQWMHQQRMADKAVFVHCHAGIGRSSSIVIAYLALVMFPEKSFDEIVDMVHTAKKDIYPHLGLSEAIRHIKNDSDYRKKLIEMSGKADYPAPRPPSTVTSISFDGVKVGEHIPARVGEPLTIRAKVECPDAAPRGVRLRTNIYRIDNDFDEILMARVSFDEIIMERVGNTAFYEAKIVPIHPGQRFWATVSVTPNEYDHFDTKRDWVGGNIYFDVSPASALSGVENIIQTIINWFLLRNAFPVMPRIILEDITRYIGRFGPQMTWFDKRVRDNPALLGQKSVLLYMPEWAGEPTPELEYLLQHNMRPIVVTATETEPRQNSSITFGQGTYAEKVIIGERSVNIYKNEYSSVRFGDTTYDDGLTVLTMLPDPADTTAAPLREEELQAGIFDLLVDLDGGIIGEVVPHPWLVFAQTAIPGAERLPVLFADKPFPRDASQDEQDQYFSDLLSAYENPVTGPVARTRKARQGAGLQKGQAGLMVQAPVKEIIDPNGKVKGDLIATVKEYALALQSHSVSIIGLDNVIRLSSDGKIQFNDVTAEEFEKLAAMTKKEMKGMQIVLPLAVPAGVSAEAFAASVTSFLKAYKGVGIRLKFEKPENIKEALGALGAKMYAKKISVETMVLVDVADSAQAVEDAKAAYGYKMTALGTQNEAVEIKVDIGASKTPGEFTAALNNQNANLVVVTIGAVPLMGESGTLNFYDILTVFGMYMGGRQSFTPDGAHAQGALMAQNAVEDLGEIDADEARTIASVLIRLLGTEGKGKGENQLRDAIAHINGLLDRKEYLSLSADVSNLSTFVNRELRSHREGKENCKEIYAGFINELLGEMLVRLMPEYTARYREKLQVAGELSELKNRLVALSAMDDKNNIPAALIKMRYGISVNEKPAREGVLNFIMDQSNDPFLRYYTAQGAAELPEPILNPSEVAEPKREALEKMLASDSSSSDVKAFAAGYEREKSGVNQAPGPVVADIKNQLSALNNRLAITPESITILMSINLDLLREYSGKDLFEAGFESAQPALRAVALMLSAA